MSNYSPEGRGLRHLSWRAPVAIATLLAGLLPAGASLALPDDRDQPIRITADTAIRDEKQGFTVYTGNVHMIQGSLDILANNRQSTNPWSRPGPKLSNTTKSRTGST